MSRVIKKNKSQLNYSKIWRSSRKLLACKKSKKVKNLHNWSEFFSAKLCAGRLYVTFSLRSWLCDAYVKNLNLLILVDSRQNNGRNSQKQPIKAFHENYFSENFAKFFEIDVGDAEWLYCNKQHQDFLHIGNFLKSLEILFKPSFWYVCIRKACYG